MKTDFLIIGAAKSATTSLCNGIAAHPEICFSQPKEPQFFSDPEWRLKLDTYNGLFKERAKLYGEGSTNYTKQPFYNANIHDDIYEYNAEMKLIYIMRHPIERLISHYVHAYNRGYERTDINSAIHTNAHFLNLSKYHYQLEPYLKVFDRSKIKLLFFHDFKHNPQAVLNDVFSFLELKPLHIEDKILHDNKGYNKKIIHYKYDKPGTIIKKLKKAFLILKHNYIQSKTIIKKPLLTNENRLFLIKELEEDVHAIEKLTRRDLSEWLR